MLRNGCFLSRLWYILSVDLLVAYRAKFCRCVLGSVEWRSPWHRLTGHSACRLAVFGQPRHCHSACQLALDSRKSLTFRAARTHDHTPPSCLRLFFLLGRPTLQRFLSLPFAHLPIFHHPTPSTNEPKRLGTHRSSSRRTVSGRIGSDVRRYERNVSPVFRRHVAIRTWSDRNTTHTARGSPHPGNTPPR